MAAKKTANKTAAPSDAETAPVAKKAAVKTAQKTPAKKAAKTAAKKTTKLGATEVTLEMITQVAYLKYRRRVELGLPGDKESDWLEAERELIK